MDELKQFEVYEKPEQELIRAEKKKAEALQMIEHYFEIVKMWDMPKCEDLPTNTVFNYIHEMKDGSEGVHGNVTIGIPWNPDRLDRILMHFAEHGFEIYDKKDLYETTEKGAYPKRTFYLMKGKYEDRYYARITITMNSSKYGSVCELVETGDFTVVPVFEARCNDG
jgi:hypothetical protein